MKFTALKYSNFFNFIIIKLTKIHKNPMKFLALTGLFALAMQAMSIQLTQEPQVHNQEMGYDDSESHELISGAQIAARNINSSRGGRGGRHHETEDQQNVESHQKTGGAIAAMGAASRGRGGRGGRGGRHEAMEQEMNDQQSHQSGAIVALGAKAAQNRRNNNRGGSSGGRGRR